MLRLPRLPRISRRLSTGTKCKGDNVMLSEQESLIEGLQTIKAYAEIEVDADHSEAESFADDAELMEKTISLVENPSSMRFMKKEEVDSLLGKLKDLEYYSKDMAHGNEGTGIVDSAWREDVLALDSARSFITAQYHVYQTEILDVKPSEYPEDNCGVVHFRQGALSGYELIPMEILGGGYTKEHLKDEEAVAKLVQTGEFELPDLYALPHYSDISPALLALYDEVKELNPAEFFYIEQELTDIAKSSKALKGQSAQDIIAQIEADMLLYPNLRESIEIDPYDTETCCVYFLNEFRTCIADDYDGGRYKKMAPIHGDVPGEKIFGQIEKALDVVAERDTHTIPNGGEVDRTLKEALSDFESLSGQEVLVSLKREAEATDVRKGSTVLHGTMKFETQKDRKDAYKWAKKWLNKSAKELDYEIYKIKEKGKGQGR